MSRELPFVTLDSNFKTAAQELLNVSGFSFAVSEQAYFLNGVYRPAIPLIFYSRDMASSQTLFRLYSMVTEEEREYYNPYFTDNLIALITDPQKSTKSLSGELGPEGDKILITLNIDEEERQRIRKVPYITSTFTLAEKNQGILLDYLAILLFPKYMTNPLDRNEIRINLEKEELRHHLSKIFIAATAMVFKGVGDTPSIMSPDLSDTNGHFVRNLNFIEF